MERLLPIGKITPKKSRNVRFSRIGIGFEKLDRDVFDPEKAYDKVADLGIKWVRIQSGWAKTEKAPGVYDFSWLDSVVDNLRARGLWPWICLCYGNGLYDEKANTIFGAVGIPPVKNERDRAGWKNYVTALAKHFAGRVEYYEVWNEPNCRYSWDQAPDPEEYGAFAAATAAAVREADPAAKIIGGAFAGTDVAYVYQALKAGLGTADALSFHEYTPDETTVPETVRCLNSLGRQFHPAMEIIQGESGSQSSSKGAGALNGGSWTKLKQAKQLLRHTVIDLSEGVKFTSYFSCMDMIEALHGKVGDKASYLDYGYFGVLGADFDENGIAVGDYSPKPSYFALQNLASLFAEDAAPAGLPYKLTPSFSPRIFAEDCREKTLLTRGFSKANGSFAIAYWNAVDLMTQTCESTLSLSTAGLPGKPRLVDPMTGVIYDLPDNMAERVGDACYTFLHLPLTDYPLFLTFGDFAD